MPISYALDAILDGELAVSWFTNETAMTMMMSNVTVQPRFLRPIWQCDATRPYVEGSLPPPDLAVQLIRRTSHLPMQNLLQNAKVSSRKWRMCPSCAGRHTNLIDKLSTINHQRTAETWSTSSGEPKWNLIISSRVLARVDPRAIVVPIGNH